MHPSCTLPSIRQVEALLEMGAALDCKDKQGRGPLHFAAANGRLPVVRHLWSRGAEADAETPGGCFGRGLPPCAATNVGGGAETVREILDVRFYSVLWDHLIRLNCSDRFHRLGVEAASVCAA